MGIATNATLADTGTMTTHTANIGTGSTTAITGTETIMTSIIQMGTIATIDKTVLARFVAASWLLFLD